MGDRDPQRREGAEDVGSQTDSEETDRESDDPSSDKEGPGASKMENLRRIDERLRRQRKRVEQTDPTLPDD